MGSDDNSWLDGPEPPLPDPLNCTSTGNPPKAYGEADPLSTKIEEIRSTVAADNNIKDLDALITLATSPNGLVNDEVRRMTCMLTLFLYIAPFSLDNQGRHFWDMRKRHPLPSSLSTHGGIFPLTKTRVK